MLTTLPLLTEVQLHRQHGCTDQIREGELLLATMRHLEPGAQKKAIVADMLPRSLAAFEKAVREHDEEKATRISAFIAGLDGFAARIVQTGQRANPTRSRLSPSARRDLVSLPLLDFTREKHDRYRF